VVISSINLPTVAGTQPIIPGTQSIVACTRPVVAGTNPEFTGFYNNRFRPKESKVVTPSK
jgi:hypothetical protein